MLLIVSVNPARAQIITSPAVAVDGDSLVLTGTRIRLFGIDAPESQQNCLRSGELWACGQDAARQLGAFVQGRMIRCEARDTDVDGRTVAVCFAGNLDLARSMIEAGLATTLSNASEDYIDAENRARGTKFGIWGSVFDTPADWRIAHRTVASHQPSAPAPRSPASAVRRNYTNSFGCAIKGNRNRQGEWIYHLPGMPYYAGTRPEELFCTEAAAMAAGYRRARIQR